MPANIDTFKRAMDYVRRLIRRSRRQITLITNSWLGSNRAHGLVAAVWTSLNSPSMRLLKRSDGLRLTISFTNKQRTQIRRQRKHYFPIFLLAAP